MNEKTTQKLVLAGGCFWGMEELLKQLHGVIKTRVGYTGGQLKDPAYADVKTGRTGHAEAVEVTYDPADISYRQIIEFFFKIHDPTTLNSQGNDHGTQYRSAIFVASKEELETARDVIQEVRNSNFWKDPICTEIAWAQNFYEAEAVHQNYLENNPGGYTCHWIRK